MYIVHAYGVKNRVYVCSICMVYRAWYRICILTVFTAAPSANSPTEGKVTTPRASREAVMPAASSASTPITYTPKAGVYIMSGLLFIGV